MDHSSLVFISPFITFIIALVSIGLLLFLVILILIVAKKIPLDRLDYNTYQLPSSADPIDLFNRFIESLNRVGYVGKRINNKYVVDVDGIFHVNIELIEKPQPMFVYYVSVESWIVVLLLVLLIPLMWIAIILGLILYLRYDSVKRIIVSTIYNTISSAT